MSKKPNKPVYRHIENEKLVLSVYLILRLLVLITMVAQMLNRNYENAFICVVTLFLFTAPAFVENRFRVDLPDTLEIIVLLFIYAAEILGEIREYYVTFRYWDTVLHTMNGFLFAALGFSLVNLLNENKKISMTLSPFYVALTAFCFSMTIGILWEFFEWSMDYFVGTDMQKDTVLTAFQSVTLDPGGHNIPFHLTNISDTIVVFSDGSTKSLGLGGYLDVGLFDTMADLFVNFVGAVVFSVIGYFYIKNKGKGRFARHFIPEAVEVTEDDKPAE